MFRLIYLFVALIALCRFLGELFLLPCLSRMS